MANFQAVFYRTSDGSEPVNDFIDELSVRRQVVLDNQIDRLNTLGPSNPHLPFPHSSQIEGELRELRCHFGRELYRICTSVRGTWSCCCTSFARTPVRCRTRKLRPRRGGGRISERVWVPRNAGLRELQAATLHETVCPYYQNW